MCVSRSEAGINHSFLYSEAAILSYKAFSYSLITNFFHLFLLPQNVVGSIMDDFTGLISGDTD